MDVLLELQKKLFHLAKGKDLVLHQKDLLTLLGKVDSSASRMLLMRAVTAGIVQNPTRRIYIFSPAKRVNPDTLYKIARKLRSGHLNYLSLESVLSQAGLIPQLPIDRITIMTTGRSQVFELDGFGVIEFTHTKKTMDTLAGQLVWDEDIEMFRAGPEYALRELKRLGRNLDMVLAEGYS
jgi:hypothetical protein